MIRVPIELYRLYDIGAHRSLRPKGWIDGYEVISIFPSLYDDTRFEVEVAHPHGDRDLNLPFDTRVGIDEAFEPEWNREIRQLRMRLGEEP